MTYFIRLRQIRTNLSASEKTYVCWIYRFIIFHNETLDIPAGKKEKGKEMIMETELPIIPGKSSDHGGAGPAPGMIFFNWESGIQMAFGLNDLVPDPDTREHNMYSIINCRILLLPQKDQVKPFSRSCHSAQNRYISER
jgi:hypothetical protein